MTQQRLVQRVIPGTENLRPPMPQYTDEAVAKEIARQITRDVNMDDFYWTEKEIGDAEWELQCALQQGVRPQLLPRHVLHRGQMWREEGAWEHLDFVGNKIATKVLTEAISEWRAKYPQPPKAHP